MDIRLPVLNGIQATRHLRAMGIKTPIIAQTAYAMDDDEDQCLKAGCDSYITKPINKEKLFQTIKFLLKEV
jgi:CheY-like chemotaxis protein